MFLDKMEADVGIQEYKEQGLRKSQELDIRSHTAVHRDVTSFLVVTLSTSAKSRHNPDQPQIPYLNFYFSGILKFNVDLITLEGIQNTCKVCSELQTTCSSLLPAWFYIGLPGRRRLHCIFVHMCYE